MKHIVENAIITDKGGKQHLYDAIQIIKTGVYTGHIIIMEEKEEFRDDEFIPRNQIQKITVCSKHGKSRDIDL